MFLATNLLCILVLFTGCESKPKVSDVKPDTPLNTPRLIKPTVRRVWIPQKIEDDGKVFEDGHWRYEVLGGSSWSK